MKWKSETRAGYPVHIYAEDVEGARSIHGAVFWDGKWNIMSWAKDGVYYESKQESIFDLVPAKKVQYLNIYRSDWARMHETKEDADRRANGNRLACVRIEYEEGQFDD